MNISQNGINLIKQFEGCRLSAYQDGGGVWTIGWGRTDGVHAGEKITQAQADAWLIAEATHFAQQVAQLVKVSINQNQFDALTSFHYNTGALGKSDLLTFVNAKNFAAAAKEFPKWVHDHKGNVEGGLVRRRAAEEALFLKPVPVPTPSSPTFYKVVSGDNLTKIALSHHTTVAALEKLNKLPNPDELKIGQMIRVH